MAAGRDDFVIAIRSAFLKKGNQQRFSLIALIIFSLILILSSKLNFKATNYLKISLNEIVYRVSFIASLPEKQINKGIVLISKHFKMYKNYENVNNEIKLLKGEKYNSKFIVEENKRLRKLIDEYIIESDELVAKVLLDKKSPFLKSIIVNKGSKDNVEMGMAVKDGPYLVGKIVEVNYTTSRALLISDLNSKIPVTLEPGNIQSILSGTGKENGEIQYMKDETKVKSQSVVFTSGSGGIFKAGIPIGKTKNHKDKISVQVDFFSDLSQITFVKLISYRKKDQ